MPRTVVRKKGLMLRLRLQRNSRPPNRPKKKRRASVLNKKPAAKRRRIKSDVVQKRSVSALMKKRLSAFVKSKKNNLVCSK